MRIARLFCVWMLALASAWCADDPKELGRKYDELYNAHEYRAALPVGQRLLAVAEKNIGPNEFLTGMMCVGLGQTENALNELKEAERYYRRGLKIYEAKKGPDHVETARVRAQFGILLYRMGRPAEAEPTFRQAIASLEKSGDPKALAATINNLAILVDDAHKAITLYERALTIYREQLGADSREAITTMSNLADKHIAIGNYEAARTLLKEALPKSEKLFGPDDAQVSACLTNLGIVFKYTDDLARAESLFQRALQIRQKTLGADHPLTGQSVRNLATVYAALGDDVRAKAAFDQAVAIYEKALGPEHPETADVLIVVGTFYSNKKDFPKAEALLQRGLRACEKAYGPQHSQTASALMSMAGLYKDMGEPAKALPLCERALPVTEKSFGSDSIPMAEALNDTAAVYKDLQKNEKAAALYTRALQIFEKRVGPLSPILQTTLSNCAFAQIDAGNREAATALSAKAALAGRKRLENVLSFTSEAERLNFQRTTHPYCLLGTLDNVGPLAETVVRTKGAVLDSLIEDRLLAEAGQDPKIHEKIERARLLKRQISQSLLEAPASSPKRTGAGGETGAPAIATELDRLEGSIAREVAGVGRARRAASVTVADIQAALPHDGVLVELIRYHHYLGENKTESRYGAIIIAPKNAPRWVPLGGASEIDRQITAYQKFIHDGADDAAAKTVLRNLYDRIWAPISTTFPSSTRKVIVSPDGQLSFVTFSTLLAPDERFLAESFSVQYIAAGRDLLQQATATSEHTIQVFANPAFDRKATSENPKTIATRAPERREMAVIQLPALPGTALEAREIQAHAGTWKYHAALGSEATELALRAVHAPRILHLATHGFFLPEVEVEEREPSGVAKVQVLLQNPMQRSGIALAGAQQTLDVWRTGHAPPTEDDGIVTAEEVGELDLKGTWLVTLSACDTGIGEARSGEGVLGLRRGFIQAGVQNLLMTLWPISDDTTVQIMLNFYERALATGNAPQSLADTQRHWLTKLRKEKGLSAAVQLAGPFIMNSQGRQE